jgi:hypothetical protein
MVYIYGRCTALRRIVPMSRSSFLLTIVAVIAALMCSPVMAQTDSLWIESITANPGGIYSVSMYGQIYHDISGLEVPLISSGDALVFDTVTKEGSIIPENMVIGGIIKNNGNRIRINFIPSMFLDTIHPPGGKLCEINFHIRPNAGDQIIAIDTLTDTIIHPVTMDTMLVWLRAYAPDGLTQIPLTFGSGDIEVVPGAACGDANDDGDVNVSDAIWIIDYIFIGSAPAALFYIADVNVDDVVNVSDAVYLINYVFRDGPEPCAD